MKKSRLAKAHETLPHLTVTKFRALLKDNLTGIPDPAFAPILDFLYQFPRPIPLSPNSPAGQSQEELSYPWRETRTVPPATVVRAWLGALPDDERFWDALIEAEDRDAASLSRVRAAEAAGQEPAFEDICALRADQIAYNYFTGIDGRFAARYGHQPPRDWAEVAAIVLGVIDLLRTWAARFEPARGRPRVHRPAVRSLVTNEQAQARQVRHAPKGTRKKRVARDAIASRREVIASYIRDAKVLLRGRYPELTRNAAHRTDLEARIEERILGLAYRSKDRITQNATKLARQKIACQHRQIAGIFQRGNYALTAKNSTRDTQSVTIAHMNEQQQYYTKSEAAAYTRSSPRSLDYARKYGLLRAFRVGNKKILFKREDLNRYVQRQAIDADLDRIVDEVVQEVVGNRL